MEKWLDKLWANGEVLLGYALTAAVILVVGRIVIRAGCSLAEKMMTMRLSREHTPEEAKRYATLTGLLQNIIRYSVLFIMAVTILDRFGVPVMAILSTAGVLGVGIAFGAQSLFKDVITGFFILLENQYYVGEYIEAQGVAGYVEKLTLRCTYLRDFDGRLHILPNGNMSLVTNHHRGGSRVLVDISISYESDIGRATEVLEQVCRKVALEFKDVLLEAPQVLGVVNLAESAVVIRLLAQSRALEQWAVERALRKEAKEAMQQAGIAIPYPHTYVILEKGEVEDGGVSGGDRTDAEKTSSLRQP